MSKTLVSEQEIVDWINNRLKEEYDGDFSIRHLQRLRGFDDNGCNWSVYFVSGGMDSGIHTIIQEAQRRFNLIDRDTL